VKTTIKTCTYCKSPYDTEVTHICGEAPAADDLAALLQPQIGMVIDKKYRLESKLGEGGMGSVFRARRLFIDDFVAVKFVRPEVLTNPEFRERFYQEARVAARIKHPNVVTVHDFGETPDGLLYLVMEFLEGMSLGELLKKKGVLALDHVIEIGLQIGEALYCMHENNVIHRDLKPDNIMLIQDGKGVEVVKVVDFGVAKILEANARLTRYQARIGSPVYCSPEQYLAQPVDHRTDLYGLGIIFYECLAGNVPFDAMNETELRAEILHKMPPRLDAKLKHVTGHMADLVQWLLAKDPNDRPRNAAEMNKCLHALRRGQKISPAAPERNAANGAAAKEREATPPGVVLDGATVFPLLETAAMTARPKATRPRENGAAPQSFEEQLARKRLRERQKTKRKKRRIGLFTFILAVVSFAGLVVWKPSYVPIASKLLSETLQQFSAEIKKLTAGKKTAKANPVSAAPNKPAPPISPSGNNSATPVVAKTSEPAMPASAANTMNGKSEAGRGSSVASRTVTPATALPGSVPPSNNRQAENSRQEARPETQRETNKPVTSRVRSMISATRIETKPAAPKKLPAIPSGMVLIKGTEFKRGDLFGDGNPNEKPAHIVKVGDFIISAHEVTNREYLAFVKATSGNLTEWMNPDSKYHYQTGTDNFYKKLGPALYSLDHPIVGVSWQDAVKYCAWLSRQGPYKYRLPTEAEWELAARGGNNAIKYSWGNGSPMLAFGGNVGDQALKTVFPDWPIIWRDYDDNFAFTAPVAKFGANKLGIYDITGNVAEWCSDWYDANYYQKKEWDRPAGPPQGTEKVIRGGSWNDTPTKLRIAYRRSAPPAFRSNNLGFRVAASVP
jgi:formylglycine-generating enzyme required for sulfatase activity